MGSHNTALRILACAISMSLFMQWSSVLAVEVSSKTGRKLLPHGVKKEAALPATHLHNTKNTDHFRFSSKIVAMAVPGVLILGCIFMFPCFRPKKKENFSAASHKGLTSMNSSSSFEGNPNLEKVPASPWRHPPPSPSASRHPPPSPSVSRHPPPSPTRRAMSPRLNKFGSIQLNFSQIAKATHSFSTSFKIGEGGFGTVYKAQLPSGHWISVKRAKKMSSGAPAVAVQATEKAGDSRGSFAWGRWGSGRGFTSGSVQNSASDQVQTVAVTMVSGQVPTASGKGVLVAGVTGSANSRELFNWGRRSNCHAKVDHGHPIHTLCDVDNSFSGQMISAQPLLLCNTSGHQGL